MMPGLLILSIPFLVQTLHKLSHKKKQVGGSDKNIWRELHTDLLGEIMGRLCLTDQARFRVVCKNWLAAARPMTPPANSLPWYFFFDRSLPTVSNILEFRVFEPSSNLALLHKISLSKLGIPSPPSYKDVSAYIQHEWLFICCVRPISSHWTRRYFILFSLFTKKIITLPMLEYTPGFKFVRFFTTKPDSPDCVFFLLDTRKADKIAVITYCSGDKEWTAREFDRVVDFLPCFCTPVYIRGILYIVSPFGQLASYNISDGEFQFETLFVDQVWIPVSTLGDKSLFISDKFIRLAIVNREGMSMSTGVLSNKIYRLFHRGCLIYSIEDGNLVEFTSINSDDGGGGKLPEYKFNCDISLSDTTKAMYWLDPPRVRY
ncbi:hypothetical protein POM88_019353 [Heracleum sosnowskyi]|uniref:F-box protein n=1 Tax=Heracleum sosnowskyi TaxID=360622 RepID=A0AAD8ISR5_9APIA|nr:hypothetical protein POM88_019353 [Heracleum sosnowskyi]